MAAAQVDEKLRSLRKTHRGEGGGDGGGFDLGGRGLVREHAAEKAGELGLARGRHRQAELEATPDGTVEQLGMVCGGDDDDVTREGVNLQQQARDDALDLASLVNVAALLADGVELVEQEHARGGADVIEQLTQSLRGLTEEASDQGVVPNDEERYGEGFGDGLGKCGLAVARRSRQQDAVAWLQAVGTQQVGAMLLLYEACHLGVDDIGQLELA